MSSRYNYTSGGYREPTAEERARINAYGGCQVIRVNTETGKDKACPHTATHDGLCLWHAFRGDLPEEEKQKESEMASKKTTTTTKAKAPAKESKPKKESKAKKQPKTKDGRGGVCSVCKEFRITTKPTKEGILRCWYCGEKERKPLRDKKKK